MAGNFDELIFGSEVVPSSLAEIIPILRAANEVEPINPRIAYLWTEPRGVRLAGLWDIYEFFGRRFYAFEKAHRLDPSGSGRGVRQFKTCLLQQLERENNQTYTGRMRKSDSVEMQSFYQQYHTKYVQPLPSATDKADRAQLTKQYQIAIVLLEVLEAITSTQAVEVNREVMETNENVAQRTELPSA